MFSDLLTSEKIAYQTLTEYNTADNALLTFDHVENKILNVIDDFKVWFRFNDDAELIDIMRQREDHWHTVLNYFRAHRYEDAMTEASNIVGA